MPGRVKINRFLTAKRQKGRRAEKVEGGKRQKGGNIQSAALRTPERRSTDAQQGYSTPSESTNL